MANTGKNAGLTNTVCRRLMAAVHIQIFQAKAAGGKDRCREPRRQISLYWITKYPMAVSSWVKTCAAFRQQMIAYLAEDAITKDFDPRPAARNAQMQLLTASFRRIPQSVDAW